MIRQAALYFPTPDDAGAALFEAAGRPVAFRALMAAVRAGIVTVGVPARLRSTAVEQAIRASPKARAASVWLDTTALDDAPTLFLPASVLVPSATLARLAGADATALLAESRGLGAPVGAGVTRAERHLYADLGSPIDTRFDTLVHRRLSLPLSRLAVAWSVAPNTITLLSLLPGLLACWCFWRASPASAGAGLVFYLVAVVLDHSDGEVARLTLTESSLGEWLDIVADTVVHGLLVLAMGVTTARAAGDGGTVLGWIAAAGVVASAALAKLSPTIVLTGGAGDRFGRLLAGLGTRDGYYAMLLAFLGLLAALPSALPALMVVVAAGSHAYWLGRAARAILQTTDRKPPTPS